MVQLKGLTPSGHLPVGLLSGGKQGLESGKNAIYETPVKESMFTLLYRNKQVIFPLYMELNMNINQGCWSLELQRLPSFSKL